MMVTGLTREDVADLGRDEKVALHEWHQRCVNGMPTPFLPAAIRSMPVRARLQLARYPEIEARWQERERRRVARSPEYFIDGYGSLQPPRGPLVPFAMWPAQRDVLRRMIEDTVIWWLKARRLGASWLGLHYDFWVVAYDERTPVARALVICKTQPDASKLLARVKNIRAHLPYWLRPDLPTVGERDSASVLKLAVGGEILALPGREAAARQETATVVHLDEFAFVPNGRASSIWTAVQPTIEGGGQLFGISTGNGRTGDGEAFADVWDLAQDPANGITPIFLPWHARPDRTREWMEAERRKYLTDEDFEAEYPETPEQALAGDATMHVYPHEGIVAAERLGSYLAESAAFIEMVEASGVEWGTDWGDFQTFSLYATDLGGGGVYVFDELVQPHTEPSAASHGIINHAPGGLAQARIVASYTDSAPAGTNATFESVLADYHDDEPTRYPDGNTRVPFSQYKQGGGARHGVNTVGYIKKMMQRSVAVMDAIDAGEKDVSLHGALALHPLGAPTLCRQLRNLERDVDTGKVKKPALDPRKTEKGDHGPDALVALCAERAAEWLASHDQEREEV